MINPIIVVRLKERCLVCDGELLHIDKRIICHGCHAVWKASWEDLPLKEWKNIYNIKYKLKGEQKWEEYTNKR